MQGCGCAGEHGDTAEKPDELDDGRGITAGRAGFTSGTHDLLLVVQRYEAAAGGASTPLTPYLPVLVAIDAVLPATVVAVVSGATVKLTSLCVPAQAAPGWAGCPTTVQAVAATGF